MLALIPTADASSIEQTLVSISKCTFPESFEKIVVIKNGPNDNDLVREIVDKADIQVPIELFFVEQANKSFALNQYIDTLDENQLLFLTDDDISFDPNVLVAFAAAASGCDAGVVLGGRLKVKSECDPPKDLLPFLPQSMTGFPGLDQQVDLDRILFLGANWAIFSDDIKLVGGFDSRFGPGSATGATGQESQLMKLLHAKGIEFRYVSDAIVWHHVEQSRYCLSFLCRRRYRSGIEAGQRLRLFPELCGHMNNKLVRVILSMAVRSQFALTAKLFRLVRFSDVKVNELKLTGHYCCGFIKGYFLAPNIR